MSVNSSLLKRKHWIFDLDGTLTVAVHNFDAIREELGIPGGLPIIKTIKSLPEKESVLLQNKLHSIEEKLARNASPARGVKTLLENLRRGDYSLGIRLAHYFREEFVIGRWCEEPKPSPKGIYKMLKQWKVTSNDALMVGDFLYDLQVGRAAETATVHVDPSGEFAWPELADIQVNSLDELAGLLPK